MAGSNYLAPRVVWLIAGPLSSRFRAGFHLGTAPRTKGHGGVNQRRAAGPAKRYKSRMAAVLPQSNRRTARRCALPGRARATAHLPLASPGTGSGNLPARLPRNRDFELAGNSARTFFLNFRTTNHPFRQCAHRKGLIAVRAHHRCGAEAALEYIL